MRWLWHPTCVTYVLRGYCICVGSWVGPVGVTNDVFDNKPRFAYDKKTRSDERKPELHKRMKTILLKFKYDETHYYYYYYYRHRHRHDKITTLSAFFDVIRLYFAGFTCLFSLYLTLTGRTYKFDDKTFSLLWDLQTYRTANSDSRRIRFYMGCGITACCLVVSLNALSVSLAYIAVAIVK